MKTVPYILLLAAVLLTASCAGRGTVLDEPAITVPDISGITVPPNIAPIGFSIPDAHRVKAVYTAGSKTVTVRSANGWIRPSRGCWRRLLKNAAGGSIELCISASVSGERLTYAPLSIYVAREEADPYIVYRLLEPGYETWNEMGIYQRNISSFSESAVIANRMDGYCCMNCHSFCDRNPEQMLFHQRVIMGGTYLVRQGQATEKLNTKTPQTISALVYPYWHPGGRYVAFSTNSTKQMFHTSDPNRIEVFDYKSDVVVYDTQEHSIFSCPQLMTDTVFETFPCFSPDGSTLYFCSADSVLIPDDYDKVQYRLCAISFDAEKKEFGSTVDTLYEGGSVSFPRISPDGRHLMFTRSGYGNFSIWHKDADLCMIDLATDSVTTLDALNSPDVESYHCWSSNGRWVVFSSRRMDKLYTRLYMAYIDADGCPGKPFLLPQKRAGYYDGLLKSYNIPEFVTGRVPRVAYDISRSARNDSGTDLSFDAR